MHVDDIAEGLKFRIGGPMREGFLALLTGDDIVEGMTGSDVALALIGRLVEALAGDKTVLPYGTIQSLQDAGFLLEGATFGDAAKAVGARPGPLRQLVAVRYPEAIEGE